ncbi:MAG: hypothetical protein ACYCDI_00500 [Corynebacterium aurimucosum]|uniref:hypothetical protein n=1 Tax=Corynebacterium TaxID=1716 RepID=UPI00143A2352|nr:MULTISPECIES: hypothetical protein [Corynebacterium]QQU94905.1 hypothetical protein I6I66_08995 [Corynebacterium aurimucosum]UTA72190.1 hypothetical protein J3S22_03635 [Corynebacterium aurimucosum]WJY70484.1 hypothetical protein CAURIM_06810 [Corynebacterium aurimucosum]
MKSRHLIPVLWIRLVVLAGFSIFIWTQDMKLLAAFSVLLVVLTAVQLVIAYRQR